MPSFRPFQLERWFAAHEHHVRHQLSASDCEPLTLGQLLRHCDLDPVELLSVRLAYNESNGTPPLRAAIAAHYDGCTADDVLVAGAPQEAIALCCQALLQPGDRVVVQTPCYQSLAEVPRQLGCQVVPWPLRDTAGGFALDLDALDRLLQQRPAMVVTNFPHNPTGVQPTAAEWRRLAAAIAASGARWLSDEMYRGLAPRDDLELPPAATIAPRALSLWGLSKSFGLPGLRLGWLVCRQREWLGSIEARKDYTSICNNALAEFLAAALLPRCAPLLRHHRATIAANTAAVAAMVARVGGVARWLPPQAGPVGLLRVGDGTASTVAEQLLPEALAVPWRLFEIDGADAPEARRLGDHWLRIGLGRLGLRDALPILEGTLTRAR